VKGDQVFWERFGVTTGNTTLFDGEIPNDGFSPNISSLYIDMADDDYVHVNTNPPPVPNMQF
jgi:hypothetical protein